MFMDSKGVLKYPHTLGKMAAIPDSEQRDYTGQLLILRPEMILSEYRVDVLQYFYAENEMDDTIMGFSLVDGQKLEISKDDFFGIADKDMLPAWAAKRLAEIEKPRMQVRIFLQNEEYPGWFKEAYGGRVSCSSLTQLRAMSRRDMIPGYVGRSIEAGDVVWACDEQHSGFYRCEGDSFCPTEFDITQTDHEDMRHVLILEPGKEAYPAEIRDSLEALQSVVGGYIEPIYPGEEGDALIYCNDEFLLNGSKPNRLVDKTLIHGTCLVIGNAVDEEGEYISVSLTEQQMEKYLEQFRYPLVDIAYQESPEMDEILDFAQE